MDFDAAWAANAQQIQQKLSESWTQALAAFRQAGGGTVPNGDAAQALPAIRFSSVRLATPPPIRIRPMGRVEATRSTASMTIGQRFSG